MKKTLLLDISLDLSDDEVSDKENDKSVYEAHLSSNFEHVSLTMNENEGNLNFLAHERRSNKLRKVKVVQTETSPDDSDVSSLESFNESLRSEDVFVGNVSLKDDRKRLSPGNVYYTWCIQIVTLSCFQLEVNLPLRLSKR